MNNFEDEPVSRDVEYGILAASDPQMLKRAVDEHLKLGWHLQGGVGVAGKWEPPMIANAPPSWSGMFAQAIWRHKEVKADA